MRRLGILSVLLAAVLSCRSLPGKTTTGSEPDLCNWLRQFKQPQPMFISEPPLKLNLTSTKHIARPDSTPAPQGNYWYSVFQDDAEGPTVVVFTGDANDLKLTVSEYRHRLFNAAWINAKLLFVELSVNPRVSVYWIVDVENKTVLTSEIDNDGVQAWQQCGLPPN